MMMMIFITGDTVKGISAKMLCAFLFSWNTHFKSHYEFYLIFFSMQVMQTFFQHSWCLFLQRERLNQVILTKYLSRDDGLFRSWTSSLWFCYTFFYSRDVCMMCTNISSSDSNLFITECKPNFQRRMCATRHCFPWLSWRVTLSAITSRDTDNILILLCFICFTLHLACSATKETPRHRILSKLNSAVIVLPCKWSTLEDTTAYVAIIRLRRSGETAVIQFIMLLPLPSSCLLLLAIVISIVNPSSSNSTCPSLCTCFAAVEYTHVDPNAVWVSCEARKLSPSSLQNFPNASHLPDKMTCLDLTFNNITILNKTGVIDNLRYLKVSANSIQVIDEHAFEGIAKLETLDVSYNNISSIPLNALKPLTNLKVLDLSNNHIEDIPKRAFDHNTQLEQLILSHNPIKIVFPAWFETLSSLRVLHITQAQLFSLIPETFSKSRQLEDLDLSGNLFQEVPNNALRLLPNLKTLKLNNNQLKVLREESFQHLTSLVELEICQNEHLVEIHKKTFGGLVNLRNLTVAMNHDLVFIDPAAFHGIYNTTNFNLRHLSLRTNSLSQLPGYSLPFLKLDFLDLRQNPWDCDCNFMWIRKIPMNILVGDPRCAKPRDLQGIEVHHIPDSICNNHHVEHEKVHQPIERTPEAKLTKTVLLLMAGTLLFTMGVTITMLIRKNDSNKKDRGSIYYVKAHTNPVMDAPVASLI